MTGFTYSEVGATAGALPEGYHHLRASRVVGLGRDDFVLASDRLLGWDVHRGAGLRVEAPGPAVPGLRMRSGLPLGPLTLWAPCEVVWLVDEPDRRGFAYGTLDGHPEVGEEAFVIRLDGEQVVFDITTFSRPATWWSRLGGPVTRLVQHRVTDRYLAAAVPPL